MNPVNFNTATWVERRSWSEKEQQQQMSLIVLIEVLFRETAAPCKRNHCSESTTISFVCVCVCVCCSLGLLMTHEGVL